MESPAPPAGPRCLVPVTLPVTPCSPWEAFWSAVIAFISSLPPPPLRLQVKRRQDGGLSAPRSAIIAQGRFDVVAGRSPRDQARRSWLEGVDTRHDTDCLAQSHF